MRTNTLILVAIALLVAGAVGFAAGTTVSQDGAKSPAAGKEHAWLAAQSGEYTAKVSGALGESRATNRIETVLGGLWSLRRFEGTMMGQPFEGLEILGFDPEKGKYVSVWVDSMTPKVMMTEGVYDADTKTLKMRGPSTGMDGQVAEMINTIVYDDTGMTFSMHMEGMPEAMMTIDYDRKK